MRLLSEHQLDLMPARLCIVHSEFACVRVVTWLKVGQGSEAAAMV